MPHVVAKTRPLIRHKTLWALIALVLAGVAWAVWRWQQPAAAGYVAAPVKVAVAPVSRQPFTRYLEAIGELEAVEQVSVPAEIGGRIVDLPIESGQRVERGQVLVRLNDAPERGQQVRLQGQVDNTRVRLDRLKQLIHSNAVSREALDDAQAEYTTARGALQELMAQIEQRTIRAPFAGTLGIRKVHVGQYVNPGDTLINLIGNKGLFVNFSVPEQALAHFKTGSPLQIELDALPGQAVTAVVSSVDPFLDRTRTLSVQARLQAPPASALPRMFARVRLPQAMPENTLSLPETAVTYSAYGEDVYVVQPAHDEKSAPTVRRVSVKTGERRDGWVVIEKGLSADDQVVTSGQIKLSDGVSIEPVTSTALAAEPGAQK
ncbi:MULTISPECIES: efflux RND transporter periplasmic adaptor subunit [Pseudomonas]|uniref:Efflux transporter periplasmic adaptor subunit n=1 Tax=Pseudomonas lundensis TaxID=86185 RepID=A0A266NCS3_9PSED|nr:MULTISPECIES: efflux RND transporter periplasmic adaptor subunit [Pseudomonas]NMY38242.1 efflux RND transporter periplasmic adaptor subunit [Pseudomonas sp. WS 5078]NMY61314.1 efflux RND transporter periplasmic adaptor subunit [Pseudomonas sp. WS 5354]OZY60210.1 efflux transporter periplasmic adaptor subunit [Pseudomonas lundensis]